MIQPRSGAAYWLSAFPPLDGGKPKDRIAVYLDLDDLVAPQPDSKLVFIGATTDEPDFDKDPDAIFIEYGWPRPTWVIPRWIRTVPQSSIRRYEADVPAVQYPALIDAVLERWWA